LIFLYSLDVDDVIMAANSIFFTRI